MGPIRIDENSTESNINEVFELEPGSVFGISPEFFEQFMHLIPRGRFFLFTSISENSPDFPKYGSNSYKVLINKKTVCL